MRAQSRRNCRLIVIKLDAHDRICQWAASWLLQRRIGSPQVARQDETPAQSRAEVRVNSVEPGILLVEEHEPGSPGTTE